ncbi:cation-translocating P-type ATPase [Flavobacterium glaciei]|uniref:Ca2+-transporting ATPase n=1 Tax=Flavobacterium glaciei TaxID=386300 RepID=A0A562Q1P7_9FLAO|nr:cation-translocating P-type ATPase [Flavobacterium glaciei]RDI57632.1 Ca2+-transporting ATPase [Flavobacterium glaciei]TWI50568.1 Ca2+-transporting ATPase [Flavobacterium glaciei]
MIETQQELKGLSNEAVLLSRTKNGSNAIVNQKKNQFLKSLFEMVLEPMFLLLLTATSIYFITGDYGNGIFMIVAIVLVSAISLYQESKSRTAIEALKKLSQPKSKVIRNGEITEILSEEIVVGDLIQTEEGTFIPADGIILKSNDFAVNESILTGESMAVFKNETAENNTVFLGTIVTSGLAICEVTAIGNKTQLGKIGKSLEAIVEEKTPLQIQMGNFVKKMSFVGLVIFGFVWVINYYNSNNVLDSLLKALTLAMSIIPEEIPVAFTTFMALGSWRLMKMGIIVKQTKTVETLGSANVICTDKTGTITENKMSLAQWYTLSDDTIKGSNTDETNTNNDIELLSLAMWASEPIPFDAMEIALHEAYSKLKIKDERPNFKLVHEYPLDGKPPMMTHIFENNNGTKYIAAKGAPEALIATSNVSENEKQQILSAMTRMALQGYRVLGVGLAEFSGTNYPKKQQEFSFHFKGLVAFYDPPKANIKAVFETFYKAGIQVKIVTGDNAETTATIAKQIGFRNADKTLNGDELMAMDDATLREKVMETSIFTRMFPEAKLKIIKALKDNNQIVAMTGDGVNDGPALKSAHIGIAMGKKGTEIAKEAANLILIDDDFSKMIDAIAMGRKIYNNLKKAIQYIISIHIPIIMIVLIPLALGWIYPNIFSPVHVIFLEIIMGPTCSIIYENEPMERNLMLLQPRPFTNTFFKLKEVTISIIQGLVITLGLLLVYQYCVGTGCSESATRTVVFLTLISSNIFLTLTNRSFYYSIFTTLKYKNNLVLMIISITILITASLLFVPFFAAFFEFEKVSGFQIGLSIIVGLVSVLWIEIYKGFKRRKVQFSE